DDAATQQNGLKRIWNTIYKYRIGFVLTSQVRAEFDQYEKMRNGVDYKIAGGWFLKHFSGMVLHVAPIKGAKGSQQLASGDKGAKLQNENLKDGVGKAEQTG